MTIASIGIEAGILVLVFVAAALVTSAAYWQVVPWWHRRINRYVAWFVAEHQQMYTSMDTERASRIISIAMLLPVLVGLLVGGWVLGVLLGAIGASGPYLWVRSRRSSRIKEIDNQLVDAMILMANGLKSGLTLLQAIELAADELKPPIADEFGRLLKEIRLGRLTDDALLAMADRLGLPDLEIAVHSIVTLRETGGNLSETFMIVANTIVERKKVEGKIDSLTAEGRYQGMIMAAMPFLLGFIFFLLDPNSMMALLTTPIGWAILAVVVVLDVIGYFAIMKVVQIEV